MALLGVGAALLLATGWIALSRLGSSPAPAEPYTPRPRIDENALIAANAERPGGSAAAAPAATENAIEASADGKPEGAAPPAPGATPGKRDEDRFDEILDDVESAVDEAGEAIDDALDGDDDGK